MELDDLKNTWEGISNQVKKQQNLHPQIIDQMTHTKYNSTLKKVIYPEVTGITICLAGAAYIGFNFSKLDTTFLQGTGVVSILLLLTLSLISFISIRRFNTIGDVNKTYAETLKEFVVQKIRFHKLQRINIFLSYLLLVTTIILISKFFGEKDITHNKYFWTFSFSLGYIFLLFYSRRVLRHYNNALRKTEEMLKEIAS